MNDLKVGLTEVRVLKREQNEQTGKETIKEIHRGVVTQNLGGFVRVFNYAPTKDGGDVSPLTSELFPVTSNRCWVEVVKTRKEEEAFRIPRELAA